MSDERPAIVARPAAKLHWFFPTTNPLTTAIHTSASPPAKSAKPTMMDTELPQKKLPPRPAPPALHRSTAAQTARNRWSKPRATTRSHDSDRPRKRSHIPAPDQSPFPLAQSAPPVQ